VALARSAPLFDAPGLSVSAPYGEPLGLSKLLKANLSVRPNFLANSGSVPASFGLPLVFPCVRVLGLFCSFKGQSNKIFCLCFFQEGAPPLIRYLKAFRI
jgi:hypothetical protein